MKRLIPKLVMAVLLAGCATTPPINNSPPRPTMYIPSDSPGPVQGSGIESQDIESMSDQMVRDILKAGVFSNRDRPPRVIMDSANFINKSTNRIDLDLITDRMLVQLQRASAGKMLFVAREAMAAAEKEHALKDSGKVDAGTNATSQMAGADYRLIGRISSRDSVDSATGMQQRYTQITFELIDLQTDIVVWSNLYTLNKATTEDKLYR